jgi:hypothetical protein
VTNTICPWALKTEAAVIGKLNSIHNAILEGRALEIPYTMMQPRMHCRTEVKVACFNGTAMYIAKTLYDGPGIGTQAEMLEFAERAIRDLKSACPDAIVDGLVRVDIFKTKTGKLVVNEFESLEADYSHSKEGDLSTMLSLYWYDKMNQYMDEISNKKSAGKKRKAAALAGTI